MDDDVEISKYAARQEHPESIRARLYAELRNGQPNKPSDRIVFSTLAATPPATQPSATPPCKLAHDLRNYTGIVLWFAETFVQQLQRETEAAREAAKLMEVVRKMAVRLHEPCMVEAVHYAYGRFSNP